MNPVPRHFFIKITALLFKQVTTEKRPDESWNKRLTQRLNITVPAQDTAARMQSHLIFHFRFWHRTVKLLIVYYIAAGIPVSSSHFLTVYCAHSEEIFHSFTCNWHLTFSCTGTKFCSPWKTNLSVTLQKPYMEIPNIIKRNSYAEVILCITLRYLIILTQKGTGLVTAFHILSMI